MRASMELLRELLGLAQVTLVKKRRSWLYSRVTSFPLKIFACGGGGGGGFLQLGFNRMVVAAGEASRGQSAFERTGPGGNAPRTSPRGGGRAPRP